MWGAPRVEASEHLKRLGLEAKARRGQRLRKFLRVLDRHRDCVGQDVEIVAEDQKANDDVGAHLGRPVDPSAESAPSFLDLYQYGE